MKIGMTMFALVVFQLSLHEILWVSGFMTKKRVSDQLPYEYYPE
jgi:hypothetical protein